MFGRTLAQKNLPERQHLTGVGGNQKAEIRTGGHDPNETKRDSSDDLLRSDGPIKTPEKSFGNLDQYKLMERHPRHQNGKEKDGLISLSTENSPSTDGLFVFGGKNLLVKAGPKKYLLIRGGGTMEDLDDETSTDFPVEEATTRSPKEEPPRSDRLLNEANFDEVKNTSLSDADPSGMKARHSTRVGQDLNKTERGTPREGARMQTGIEEVANSFLLDEEVANSFLLDEETNASQIESNVEEQISSSGHQNGLLPDPSEMKKEIPDRGQKKSAVIRFGDPPMLDELNWPQEISEGHLTDVGWGPDESGKGVLRKPLWLKRFTSHFREGGRIRPNEQVEVELLGRKKKSSISKNVPNPISF